MNSNYGTGAAEESAGVSGLMAIEEAFCIIMCTARRVKHVYYKLTTSRCHPWCSWVPSNVCIRTKRKIKTSAATTSLHALMCLHHSNMQFNEYPAQALCPNFLFPFQNPNKLAWIIWKWAYPIHYKRVVLLSIIIKYNINKNFCC